MNLQSETFVKRATACSTGSIFKGIRINSLMDSEIILPPLSVTKEFSKEIKPLFALQKELDRETHTLIQLRDWLLPMLMNGQAKEILMKKAENIKLLLVFCMLLHILSR